MDDLISRQQAIDLRFTQAINEDGVIYVPLREYLNGIKSLPTVDVVEVVRCKDCTYFDKYIDCKEMYQWDGFCADWARKTYENWYCSRAERRNDG